MGFFKKNEHANYDLLSGYSWYLPGAAGILALIGFLLIGSLLGNLVLLAFSALSGTAAASEYGILLSYPLIFIPAMIWTRHKSLMNKFFSEKGYAVDSRHFAPFKAGWMALCCMAATIALSIALDPLNLILPPMPEWLEKLLTQETQGNFFLNFLCVSILAPFFEEWLCRGMILRGLLNFKRTDGSGKRGLPPAAAVTLSALFFAALHLNPWQAAPALAMGLLFGYVYYKTGSLKLTMLMHFTNNTLALLLVRTDLGSADSLHECLPAGLYLPLIGAAALLLVLCVLRLRTVRTESPQGGCDPIPPEGVPTE